MTAAASLAVVLGVGGVAAATSGHGSHSDDPAETASSTSAVVVDAHHQRGKGLGSRHLKEATSTTVGDDETSTTVDDDATSTTIADETSTTVDGTTSTTVEDDDDHGRVCDRDGDEQESRGRDDEGEAAEHAHRHGNTQAHLDKCANGDLHRSDAGDSHRGRG